MVRKMFAGGNTARGFHSFFQYIIGEDAERIYLLKGGPGTGKSTFMKRIGEVAEQSGMEVELFYCSSDPDSLDGIHLLKQKVAIVDATAPHIQDPRLPGCRDELINLGDLWNRDGITANRVEITRLTYDNSQWFQRAYRYLRAVQPLDENIAAQADLGVDKQAIQRVAKEIVTEVFPRENVDVAAQVSPPLRRLFASAITPQGVVSHVHNLVKGYRPIILSGAPQSIISWILEHVISIAQFQGRQLEVFYCHLNPEEIEHIFLPEAGTAVLTSAPYQPLTDLNGIHFDLSPYVNTDQVFSTDLRLREQLMEQAVAMLREAKKVHDDLEAHYVKYMDFEAVNRLLAKIIAQITN